MSDNLHDDLEKVYRERLQAIIVRLKNDYELLNDHENEERVAKTPEDKQRERQAIQRLHESIQKSEEEYETLQNKLETLQQKQRTKLEQEKYGTQPTSLHQELEQQRQIYSETLRQELQQQQEIYLETLRQELQQQQTYLETLYQELQHQQPETVFPSQYSVSPDINFIHSYPLPKIWVNRERELKKLENEIIYDKRHRVIALISIGGSGKSALVRKLLSELSLHEAKLQHCFWFSFSDSKKPDVNFFLVQAFSKLLKGLDLDKYPDPFDKALELKNWLAQNRCLLVLDGLETVLESDWTSSTFGKCIDAELSNFLKGICSDQKLSQLIITSRYQPSELKDQEGYRAIELPDLLPDEAERYMQQRGVRGSGDDINKACRLYGYHILSLSILADYLSQPPYSGDISGIKSLEQLPTENEAGSKLQSILNDYWEKLTPAGRLLITRLTALHNTNVTKDILRLLANDNDGHYCEMSHPEFHLALRRLLESMLLKVQSDGARTTYIVHPLIKTYFYNRLGQEERRKIHTELKDRLRLVPFPDKPQTLDDLNTRIEAYHQYLRAGLYNEAYEIYRKQRLNRRVFWWGEYAYAKEKLLQHLLDAYENRAWSATPDQAGYILQEAGIINSKSGDPRRAMDYHQLSIEASKENRALKLKGWLYQSELWMEMGYFDMAEETLEKAKKVESEMKELGQPVKEYLVSGCQGYYYAASGRIEGAKEQLMKAITLCQDKAPAYCCLYLRIRGDLYLRTKELSEAEEDYKKALALSRNPANVLRDYEGHILRGLGDLYRLKGEYGQAQAYYEEALNKIAKIKGYTWLEAEIEIGLATLALANNDLAGASNHAKNVLDHPLKSSEWLIQQIQAHIVLAKTSYQRSPEDAKTHIDTAKDLVSKSGHFWSQIELEELNER